MAQKKEKQAKSDSLELKYGKSLEEIEEKNIQDEMKRKEEKVKDKEDKDLNEAHSRPLVRLGREAREAYEDRKYDGHYFNRGACCAGGYCLYREEELNPFKKFTISLNIVHWQ